MRAAHLIEAGGLGAEPHRVDEEDPGDVDVGEAVRGRVGGDHSLPSLGRHLALTSCVRRIVLQKGPSEGS